MRGLIVGLGAIAIAGFGVFWALTRPVPLRDDIAVNHKPDAQAGALVFAAAGCASCHVAPNSEDKTILAGGQPFETEFGTFHAPNITPSPVGIGYWTLSQFTRAVTQGVSPDGEHYYPAFPYTSYTHMTDADVADLFAYMQDLPASDTPSKAHDVSFPYNIRRGLGLWKTRYHQEDYVIETDQSDALARGRYLVEGLGHCAECHTPRDALGGLDRSAWMTGAPNPSGKGRIPNITPAKLSWSESDLVEYFTSGFTPEYDSVGGSMAAVVENLAKLPESDRAAIAAYLKALPAAE